MGKFEQWAESRNRPGTADGRKKKKKPYGKMFFAGVISVALYIVLLSNQETVTEYYTKGGLYAFFPILTAFLFSLVHGTFTGNFWTVMGIEASKKHTEVK